MEALRDLPRKPTQGLTAKARLYPEQLQKPFPVPRVQQG